MRVYSVMAWRTEELDESYQVGLNIYKLMPAACPVAVLCNMIA